MKIQNLTERLIKSRLAGTLGQRVLFTRLAICNVLQCNNTILSLLDILLKVIQTNKAVIIAVMMTVVVVCVSVCGWGGKQVLLKGRLRLAAYYL